MGWNIRLTFAALRIRFGVYKFPVLSGHVLSKSSRPVLLFQLFNRSRGDRLVRRKMQEPIWYSIPEGNSSSWFASHWPTSVKIKEISSLFYNSIFCINMIMMWVKFSSAYFYSITLGHFPGIACNIKILHVFASG